MLDILISMTIGSILLLSIMIAGHVINENSQLMNDQVVVQKMLISNAQLVEGEFRNMGMGVPEGDATVLAATDTSITFLSDLDRDGTPEQLKYWVGSPGELSSSQNDQDRLLHRQVDGGMVASIGVVTRFSLKYFSQGQMDTLLSPVDSADLEMIKVVEITMEVQNPAALYRDKRDVKDGERDALYSSSLWRQTRLASQNLKR
ncbi:MAG TPA: hypothetical protein VI932_10925 [Bacteroidota bacterium]|nr:hypothetical protein [Bacteroidota bacterium]